MQLPGFQRRTGACPCMCTAGASGRLAPLCSPRCSLPDCIRNCACLWQAVHWLTWQAAGMDCSHMGKLPGMQIVSLLICTTTSFIMPLQTPHPSEAGLHGAACALVGWLWVSSMGLCPCLSWDGACPFSDPSYCLLQNWFRHLLIFQT